MHHHISMSQYIHTFICIKIFMIRLKKSPRSCKDWQHPVCQWSWNESHLQTCNRVWNVGGLCSVDSERILPDEYNLQLPGGGNLNSRWHQSLESSISMAVTISIMYVALSGLGKISVIWRPLFSHCVSLQMLSSLNTFKYMGIPVLLIPHLPPSSPPCLGCGIVILLQSSISWCHIILVYLLWIIFVIFAAAESTFVVCSQSTAPFVIVFLVAHCIGS